MDDNNLKYEVDFLPVGEGEKSGDAITFRFSRDNGRSWVIGVIDGGTKDSGTALCEHIKTHYGNPSQINMVLLTHPDGDHASGLTEVLNSFDVKLLVMHQPWNHVSEIFDKISDDRVTQDSMVKRLQEELPFAYELEKLALSKRIPITEPFSDGFISTSPFNILSPSKTFYLDQLLGFRSVAPITEEQKSIGFVATLAKAATEAIKWIIETWNSESLAEPDENATSCENNSSVVLLINVGKLLLFTGDAGVPALSEASNRAKLLGINLPSCAFVQIPHHGSKRNVSPAVLNEIIGGIQPEGASARFTAFISASKDGEPKHPSKRVVNAFKRRGAGITVTKGLAICHKNNMPTRAGWGDAPLLPFYDRVEDDTD